MILIKQKWEEEFWKSSAFQSVLEIGYTREQIKLAYSARSCKGNKCVKQLTPNFLKCHKDNEFIVVFFI